MVRAVPPPPIEPRHSLPLTVARRHGGGLSPPSLYDGGQFGAGCDEVLSHADGTTVSEISDYSWVHVVENVELQSGEGIITRKNGTRACSHGAALKSKLARRVPQ